MDARTLDQMAFRFSPGRGPAVPGSAMAATSQPLGILADL